MAEAGREDGALAAARVAVLVPCFNEELAVTKVVVDFRAALPQAESRRQEGGQRQQQSGRRPVQARRQENASGAKSTKRFFKRPKRGPGT